MNEVKDIDKPTKKAWSIGVVVARFFMLFKPKCPKCGSRDNKVECYAVNTYTRNERWQTGRQCNNCINFWYN